MYVRTGHNNGRNLPCFWPLGKLLEQLVAAQTGQMDVKNDQIGGLLVDRAKRRPAIGGVDGVETGHPQHAAIQLREIAVVFHEENAFPMTRPHAGVSYNFYSRLN